MICIKESTFNLVGNNANYKIYASPDGLKRTFIYHDFYDELNYIEFVNLITDFKGEKTAYIFSFSNTLDYLLVKDIEHICRVEGIPGKLLEIYKNNTLISKG